jgi:hypothetical protein
MRSPTGTPAESIVPAAPRERNGPGEHPAPVAEGALPALGSVIRSAVRGWDRFWFRPQDPTTLSFIRLCAGLVIFYVHLTYSWGLLSYVGPEAWIDDEMATYIRNDVEVWSVDTGWEETPKLIGHGNYYWSVFFHAKQTGWIIAFHVLFLAAMLLMTVGLWTRYAIAVSWVGAMSYVQRASSTVFGLDTMMMIVLFYLLIGPSGAALSVDSWLRKRRERRQGLEPQDAPPSVAANFAIRLIQVHFCIIYFASGTSKLLGTTWWSGTALNLVMLNAEFAPMNHWWYYQGLKFLAGHRWMWETFMAVQIVGTILMEVGLPFLIWNPRCRWALICGSVLLHTGIAVFMGLTTFSLIMICIVASFIPPEVIKQLAGRVSEQASRLLASRTEAAGSRELALTRS